MMVSFIIPVYNTARYLERCVDSILNQGIDESLFEIIIVNDGSTDDSALIIDRLAKHRTCIKCIHTENRGLGAARNRGMAVARGKYIFFVDSDDYLFEHSLSGLFDYAKSATADMIGFDWRYVYSNGSIIEKWRNASVYNLLIQGADYLNCFNLSGGVCPYLFSATFLREFSILMPEGIYHEDELFLTEAFVYARQVMFINHLVYAYYQRNDSITNNKDKQQIDKRISDTLYTLDQLTVLEKKADLSELQKKAVKRKTASLTVDFIVNLIRFRADKSTIENRIDELTKHKLYPLPNDPYSLKYKIFRTVFNYRQNIVWASKLGLFRKD